VIAVSPAGFQVRYDVVHHPYFGSGFAAPEDNLLAIGMCAQVASQKGDIGREV
jgi:hypothetical protein